MKTTVGNFPALPPPTNPKPPVNVFHKTSKAINEVVGLPGKAIMLMNDGFAQATQSIAALFPAFPAATLGSLAIGLPHAHTAHPPSGPPPIPPIPLPPIGPVLLGNCVSVLIGGRPAARCGDLGISPTCCGLPPLFEIFTGSSNVFIGGGRAARMTDITFHCKSAKTPSGGAMKAAMASTSMASKALGAAGKVMNIAGKVAQVSDIAGDAVEAMETDDAAEAQARALSAAMKAAQMANDAVAAAIGAMMGKDIPCVPPGSLGMILLGNPTVLIGGFPMPSWSNVLKGMKKLAKGLKGKRKGKGAGRSSSGTSHKS